MSVKAPSLVRLVNQWSSVTYDRFLGFQVYSATTAPVLQVLEVVLFKLRTLLNN